MFECCNAVRADGFVSGRTPPHWVSVVDGFTHSLTKLDRCPFHHVVLLLLLLLDSKPRVGSADNSDEIRCSHFSSHVGIDSGAVGVLPSSLFELRNRADPVRAGASTASFPRSALTRFTEFLPSCFRRLRSVVFFFFGGGGVVSFCVLTAVWLNFNGGNSVLGPDRRLQKKSKKKLGKNPVTNPKLAIVSKWSAPGPLQSAADSAVTIRGQIVLDATGMAAALLTACQSFTVRY